MFTFSVPGGACVNFHHAKNRFLCNAKKATGTIAWQVISYHRPNINRHLLGLWYAPKAIIPAAYPLDFDFRRGLPLLEARKGFELTLLQKATPLAPEKKDVKESARHLAIKKHVSMSIFRQIFSLPFGELETVTWHPKQHTFINVSAAPTARRTSAKVNETPIPDDHKNADVINKEVDICRQAINPQV